MITDALRDAVAEKILNETVHNDLPLEAHDPAIVAQMREKANKLMEFEFVRSALAQTLWY